MSKKTHTGAHLFQRFDLDSGKPIYKCMIPACSTYISSEHLMINRLCLCLTCHKEFILTQDYIENKIKKLLCPECRGERRERRKELADVPILES